MYKVYLLLGSNMGDRQAMLDSANLELIDALLPDYLEVAELGDAVNTSQVMETHIQCATERSCHRSGYLCALYQKSAAMERAALERKRYS